MRWWPIALVGLGCPEAPADPTVPDPPDDTPTPTEPCDNVVVAQDPADGAVDVAADADVTFTLAEPDPDAVISVVDAAGDDVPGASAVADARVTWTPGAPLADEAGYTATLTHACGTAATSWTTAAAPEPEPLDPTGTAFAIDLASGTWLEPAGIGALLADQLGDTEVYVEAVGADLEGTDLTLDLLLALGEAGLQDPCSATSLVPAVPYTDPDLLLIAPSLVLQISGFDVTLEDVEVTGTFAPDLSRIAAVRFGGSLDTRTLGEAFGLGDDPGAVCLLVETFGVTCVPCPSGLGPTCLDVRVEDLVAPAVPGLALQERTAADIEDDPLCD